MPNTTARLWIFALWGLSFLVMIFALELAPGLRQGVIAPADAHAALIKMAALFVPVLTAFATFWFRPGTDGALVQVVPRDRANIAIVITVAYHLVVVGLLMYATYGQQYASGEAGDFIPPITFNEWVTNVLQIGLFASPIATAPSAYLLGIEKIEVGLAPPGQP